MKISNTKISRSRIVSPVDYDVHFSDVVLLLHMDGADASTTFTDSSFTPKSVTANGGAQISTAQWRFGGSSALFDGNGDWLSVAGSADFTFGTGDFTVEGWFYQRALGNPNYFTFGSQQWNVYHSASNVIRFWDGTTFQITGGAVALNVWHHIALTRQGTQVRLFLNGVQQGSTWTNTGPTNLGQATFYIGYYPAATEFNGYIDDFRVTKGVARYTSNFTPPTRAFPDYGGRVFFSNTINNLPTIPISDVAFFSNTVNNIPTIPISDVAFFSNTVNNILTVASPIPI